MNTNVNDIVTNALVGLQKRLNGITREDELKEMNKQDLVDTILKLEEQVRYLRQNQRDY